ncbi:MAG: acetate--CoA ligase family protein [Parcubacteria group bacterium]|jgi:acetyltransferase
MELNKLFNPTSIAIVGASEEEGKVGNVIAKNILTLGYSGKVFLVNPKHETLFGQKCYKSLSEIQESVDLAMIIIPAKFVTAEISNNADRIKNYVIISAGFSEIGEEGKKREEELAKIAKEKDLNILGPNCLGFIAPEIKLNATFAGGMPEMGNIALVSQSGALAVGMLDIAEKDDYGFSYVISIGNKMSLDESDVLEYLASDEKTKVIGMYLEGIKNGSKFLEVAAKVSKVKPVVLLKAGKTEKSQKAISSHTGALAGSDEIISTICEKIGIMRAENLEEFFNLINLVSLTDPPKTNLVAVVTNAGGPGVLATDAFKDKNIKLADISDKIKLNLRKFLPEESSVENPIDVLGDAHEDRYKKVLATLGKDAGIGSFISILTPQDQTPVNKIASKIIQFKNKNQATIVTSFIGGKRIERAVKKLRESGVPNFRFPHSAVEALDKYYGWNNKRSNAVAENYVPDNERISKIRAIIEKAKGEGRGALYFSEAKTVMDLYGIKTVDIKEIMSNFQGSTLEVKFPVVLKVDSDKVLHKTDKQGILLNIKDQEELDKSIKIMQTNFPGERLIIQSMLERKTELIVGIKKDEVFGPVVVYGLGGIYTEVFRMVDFLVPPATQEETEKEIAKSKIKFLFSETRGQKAYNVKELSNILLGTSQLAQEIAEIVEFDINPLLIYNNGKEAVAVDVKIII